MLSEYFEYWVEFQQLVSTFMPYVTGALLVYVINQVKVQFKLKGNEVLALTIGFSVIVGVLSLIAENQINPDTFAVANIAETALAVFVSATAWYVRVSKPRLLKAKQGAEDGESGQGLYAYAAIIMVATVITFAVLSVFGPEIGQVFSQIVSAV